MRIAKEDIPAKIKVPGATARQAVDFGDTTAYSSLSAEYFSLAAGLDISPLLEGLVADACQAPHWGYMIEGRVVVTYTDGTADTCTAGDLFYWPEGHTVRVVDDAEVILFSPQAEHSHVMEHMLAKLG